MWCGTLDADCPGAELCCEMCPVQLWGMNFMVEELHVHLAICSPLLFPSNADLSFALQCPFPPLRVCYLAKPRQLVQVSSTKFLYHLKQSPAKLLLTMWIPADLSLCLACLRCLGCASSRGKLSVDMSSQSFLSQTWDSDTESKRVWWVHEWFLEDCWS